MAFEALYLHVPFCRARCAYCDFDTCAKGPQELPPLSGAYVDWLTARLEALGGRNVLRDVKTVYIGGGTPTVLGMSLSVLVRCVRHWCKPEEFTCEANPESFTDSLARALKASGVTRISLGVQSLSDEELRLVGRIHTANMALAALERAKRLGFSTSCDLICNLPGQTLESWGATLDRLIEAGSDHVSVYPLQLEDGTPLAHRVATGELAAPDEDFQGEAMLLARQRLMTAGFEPYEVASYAKPGHACRHNIAYWTGKSYLGLGRSAASMASSEEIAAMPHPFAASVFGAQVAAAASTSSSRIRFKQLDDSGADVEVETMTEREAMAEDLMLACRMTAGIPVDLLHRATTVIPVGDLRDACERAVSLGLATWTGTALTPTDLGWLDGNELFELFWDLAR